MSDEGESDLEVFKTVEGIGSSAPTPLAKGEGQLGTTPPSVGESEAGSAASADAALLDDTELLDDLDDDDELEDEAPPSGDALQILSGASSPAPSPLAAAVPPLGLAPPPKHLAAPSRPTLPPPSAPGSSLPPAALIGSRPPAGPGSSLPPAAPAPPPGLLPPISAGAQSGSDGTGAPPQAIGWDDEDDQTTVFTRNELLGGLGGLLNPTIPKPSGVPGAPPPMSRPSAPVPTAPHQTIASLRRASSPASTPAPSSVPPTGTTNRTPLVFAAVAAALVALALFFVLRPTQGALTVTVAGPVGEPLDEVQVFVDGKSRCSSSPCKLEELEAGTHMVHAEAAGHLGTADRAVTISGGQEAVMNIKLERAAGTGFRISASGSGHTLFVDGKEIGPLPQEMKDLSSGDHVVTIKSDHYEEWKQTISVRPNEMQTIGPLKLKVTSGLAHIRAGGGADGARIVLESNGDRRALPTPPVNVSIETSKPHTLIATKRGFETFRQVLEFSDGEAERTFEIVMNQKADQVPTTPAPNPVSRPTPAAPTESTGGSGMLNINSIPASKILLDGRPLGSTPKVGISVPAGSHSVVFAKDGQRKSKRVTVRAGETATVVHRF